MTSTSNSQSLHQQAKTYLSQKRIQDAITLCSQILEADPKFAPAYQTLGKGLYLAKRLEEAEKCYRQALALNPNDATTYNNLGSLYAQQQEWKKALTCYGKAIEIEPRMSGVYRNLGRLWTQLGDSYRAEEAWFRAYSLEPKKVSRKEHITLGDQLLQRNEIEKAITCYRRGIDLNPNGRQVLEKLGIALKRAGEEVAPSRSHFIIFTLGRTGSSTLVKLLNAHPELNCQHEPFNQDCRIPLKNTYLDGISEDMGLKLDAERSRSSQHWVAQYPLPVLDRVLQDIKKAYCGIKHLDYSLSFDQNLHLLMNAYDKVIFLRRKNRLKRMVSVQISLQAKQFQGNRNNLFEKEYQPLDVDNLRGQIKWAKQRMDRYHKIITSLGKEIFDLNYEDLLDPKLTLNDKIAKLNEVYGYLGVSEITQSAHMEQVKSLLDPKTNKFNDEATYRLIPNINEVAEKLGSDETGYLFE
ncbi:MAG: tetratricopeptide repeat protein [Halothece sp. Uz-M2-17]|nr:tetratricopeptide repeat protein [Halothece sp. Uz-M2-17]